jgi:hypothetical protein
VVPIKFIYYIRSGYSLSFWAAASELSGRASAFCKCKLASACRLRGGGEAVGAQVQ